MNDFNYKDIPLLIAYLGEATADELSIFVKQDKVKIFNELERLVKKEKIEYKLVCGELVYRFIVD